MFTPTNHGFSADLMKTVRDILEEGVPKTSAGATEAKVVQAVGQIKHFAKEMYKGDIKKAYKDWAAKTTFGPALKADVLKRAGGVNEATDPVDKKELTKSFEKRKDKDIDNDGDTDSSDEYLHKRRKAISKAMKEEVLDEAQKLFMFKTKQEADKKAKEIKGKVIELGPKNFAVVTKDLTVIEEVDLDEDASVYKGFINLGGAKVKDDEKSILQHIKKTFPNVKKVKKDSQHGWIPVFEEVDLDEDVSVYKKTARKNKNDVTYAFGRTKKLDGQPEEKGGYWVWKLSKNYDGKVRGGIRASWVYVGKDLSYSDAVKLMNKKLGRKEFKEEVELDELSKKTLGSYVKGASHDIATKSAATGRYSERANKARKTGDYSQYKDDETADKMFNKSWKRRIGVAKAVDKLTKEEVEEEVSMEFETIDDIQEASSETIANLRERLKQARAKMDEATSHSAMTRAMNVVQSLNKQLKNATMSEGKEDKSVKETEAEKNDEDGDGKKDKKKNKKNGDKVETIDTKPSVDSNTMVQNESMEAADDIQERAAKGLSASEKEKLGQLKSKYENSKMHRTLRKQYGDKGDDIFYGKLTKMAKGEYNGADSKNEELEFTSEDFNSLEELAAIGRGEDNVKEATMLGLKEAGKWNYPADMTKTKEISDMGTTNAAKNREERKEWRKKHKALQHKKLVQTKEARGEELTELSKKTLGSYVKKASHDVATNAAATGRYADRANKLSDEMKASGDYSKEMERRKNNKVADKAFDKSWKRRGGIAKAVDKMTAEEVYIDGELTEAMGSVTIDSEGHRLHGKKGSIFHKHADGRINVQVKTGPRKGDVNNLTLKPGEFKTVKEDLDLEEEAKKRGRPPRGDDADDSADRNFVMQMRKAVSLRGQYDTVFDDGTKKKTSAEAGQNFLNKYNALTRPAQKELFMKSASKSPKHFAMALQGKVEKPKNYLALPGLKSDKLDK
jgi:hypothetical protein